MKPAERRALRVDPAGRGHGADARPMKTFAKSLANKTAWRCGAGARAVVLLVLLPLAFGTSELGRAITEYNTIVKSARDATRYLTLFETPSRASGCDLPRVRDSVVTPGPNLRGTPLLREPAFGDSAGGVPASRTS